MATATGAERLLDAADDDGGAAALAAPPLQDTRAWRALHALGFTIGGVTFIAGTAAYWAPPSDAAANAAAALYTTGSLGFLTVDVLEFFTPAYAAAYPLRYNIACSALGSTLYVVGSVGFFAPVLAATPAVGVWGFLLGSAAIAGSQAWKVARLSVGADGRCALRALLASRDVLTAAGVEASAGLGAAHFLVGTAMYAVATEPPAWMNAVLAVWLLGSAWFSLGAGFLCVRHFVMGVS